MADVRLEDCLDLKDTLGWLPLLAQRTSRCSASTENRVVRSPDRQVTSIRLTARSWSSPLRPSRVKAFGFVPYAAYSPKEPRLPGSFLSEGSHVQVAVRDTDLISNVQVVPATVLGHRAHAGSLDPEDASERMRRRMRHRGG